MMGNELSEEEVAALIRARKIVNDKKLPKYMDVTKICEAAGISRKTGYQWAEKWSKGRVQQDGSLKEEVDRLKAENEDVKKRNRWLEIENEGRRLAWEIHNVDELLAEKKHYQQGEKGKAVRFLRHVELCFRDAGRLLSVSSSALSGWNKCFDEGMRPRNGKRKFAKNNGKRNDNIFRLMPERNRPDRLRIVRSCNGSIRSFGTTA
jgi:transposase-like protein